MYIDQVMFTLVLVVRRCQSFFFCYHPLDSINFICSFSVFILHLTGDCAQIKMNTIFCNKNTQLFPEGGSHFKWPKVRVHTLGDLSISIWEGRKKNALCEFFCSRRARSTFKWETQTAMFMLTCHSVCAMWPPGRTISIAFYFHIDVWWWHRENNIASLRLSICSTDACHDGAPRIFCLFWYSASLCRATLNARAVVEIWNSLNVFFFCADAPTRVVSNDGLGGQPSSAGGKGVENA